MLPADLIAFSGLHGGILIVNVVELNLYRLNLGVLRENPVKHGGFVVEGNAEVRFFPSFLNSGAVS